MTIISLIRYTKPLRANNTFNNNNLQIQIDVLLKII